jgi:hypothetical protein
MTRESVSATSSREKSLPVSVIAGRLGAALSTAWLSSRAVVDPDLWGHLRFGLDLLETGRLTSEDPYSFTQDVPWINHEWLSELLFAVAYRAGGVIGLIVLKTIVLGLTAWLLSGVARRADPRWRGWLVAMGVVGLTAAAVTFRPQLWTILGLAVLCRILSTGRGLAWMPLVFALWANLHGGWIVGAGLAALWTAGHVLDQRRLRAAIPVGAALVVSLVATLANPYGWRLWLFLLTTVRMSRNITEWRPLWEQPDFSHGVLWMVNVTLVAATMAWRWRQLTWASLFPVVWLGASGLFVDRLSPLFAEIALLVTAQGWAPPASAPASPRSRMPAGTLAIDALAVIVLWMSNAAPASRCLSVESEAAPDLAAANVFFSESVTGRLVLPFDWGEYAIWHWGPRLKVSMDGRRETVYSDATVNQQASIAFGQPEGMEYLDRVRPEYVWLSYRFAAPTAAWLETHGYRIDVKTDKSFVAVRNDLPMLIERAPAPRCFR